MRTIRLVAQEQTIGQRIRAMRIERGIKRQEELAARLTALGYPTTRRVVTAWESGEYLPGVLHMVGLSEILRVGQEYLLRGEQSASGDSEFIVRMRGLEDLLDARARRMLLALAAQQARELQEEKALAAQDASAGMTDEQRKIAEELNEETQDEETEE